MAVRSNHGSELDEEPTEPIPGEHSEPGPARPSLAPTLSTRISEAPTAPAGTPSSSPRLRWLFAGGMLITLALLIVVVSRVLTQSERATQILIPVPVAVPDPNLIDEEKPPEPAPDPAQALAAPVPPAEPVATPGPAAESELESAASEEEVETTPLEESPPEHLAVIVHPDNPVSEMSVDEIRRIYLEERKWSDGSIARPVGRYRAPALRRVFLELVLGTNHQAIKTHWEAKKEEGLERVRRLATDEAVIQQVSKRRDTIGYVDWAKLSSEQQAQVKKVFEIKLK